MTPTQTMCKLVCSNPCSGSQIPDCVANSGATPPPLLALAVRLPFGIASPDWVLGVLGAAVPNATCMSSATQVDVRTDVQVRVLGRMPSATPAASGAAVAGQSGGQSGGQQLAGLREAALGVSPLLLPPLGAPISLTTGVASQASVLDVLSAAEGADAGSGSPAAGSPPQAPPSAPGAAPSSDNSGTSSVAVVALASVLAGVAVAAVVVGLAVWWLRRHSTQGASDAAVEPPTKQFPPTANLGGSLYLLPGGTASLHQPAVSPIRHHDLNAGQQGTARLLRWGKDCSAASMYPSTSHSGSAGSQTMWSSNELYGMGADPTGLNPLTNNASPHNAAAQINSSYVAQPLPAGQEPVHVQRHTSEAHPQHPAPSNRPAAHGQAADNAAGMLSRGNSSNAPQTVPHGTVTPDRLAGVSGVWGNSKVAIGGTPVAAVLLGQQGRGHPAKTSVGIPSAPPPAVSRTKQVGHGISKSGKGGGTGGHRSAGSGLPVQEPQGHTSQGVGARGAIAPSPLHPPSAVDWALSSIARAQQQGQEPGQGQGQRHVGLPRGQGQGLAAAQSGPQQQQRFGPAQVRPLHPQTAAVPRHGTAHSIYCVPSTPATGPPAVTHCPTRMP